MFADRFAKHVDHQIRKSVHHARLVAKPLSRVNHTQHFDDPLYSVEAAERRSYLGQHNESNLTGGVVAFLDREILANLTLVLPPGTRRIASEEKQISNPYGVDIIGNGWRH